MLHKKYYTYLHCKPDGTPFYVGKGSDVNKNIRRSHQFSGRSDWHKHIVKKYGAENILIYVFQCDSEAHALSDEIQQIAQLRSEGYKLCNLTNGGEGTSGIKKSEKEIERLRQDCIKKWTGRKHTEETKKKISMAKIGCVSPRRGIKALNETIKKLSESHTEIMQSDISKKRNSESQKLAWQNPEIRKKRIEGLKEWWKDRRKIKFC